MTELEPGTSKNEIQSAMRELLPLPGLAAIGLYLSILAGVIILGVVNGRHYPPLFLVLAAALVTASGGLLLLFRWAWAMADARS